MDGTTNATASVEVVPSKPSDVRIAEALERIADYLEQLADCANVGGDGEMYFYIEKNRAPGQTR
jgi:hypothetical protein